MQNKDKLKFIFGIFILVSLALIFLTLMNDASAKTDTCYEIKSETKCLDANNNVIYLFGNGGYGIEQSTEPATNMVWLLVNKDWKGNKEKGVKITAGILKCKTYPQGLTESVLENCKIEGATKKATASKANACTKEHSDFKCIELGNSYSTLFSSNNKQADDSYVGIFKEKKTTCYKGLCPGDSDACCKQEDQPAGTEKAQTSGTCPTDYICKTDSVTTCPDKWTQDSAKTKCKSNNADGVCCKSTESPGVKDVPVSFLQRAGWNFASLCLGQSKKMNSLENQMNFLTKNKAGLVSLKNIPGNGDNKKLSEINDADKAKWGLDKLVPVLGVNSNQNPTLSELVKLTDQGIINTNNSIKDLQKKSGRLTHPAETIASLIACAYGVAGGTALASGSGDCRAETAHGGTDYCGLCNTYEPFMQCTADRCGILGNCRTEAKQDGTGYLCLPAECTGASSAVPHISRMRMEWYQGRLIQNGTDPTGTGFISGESYIKPATQKVSYLVDTLNLTIQTDQASKCRYSFVNGTAFSEMTMNFDDAWKYPTTSTTMVDLTGLPLGRTHTIYIKCESTCGATNDVSDDSQYVKFTFENRPDKLPPEIVRVVPDDKTQYLNHNDTSAVIEVWLNENGNCRYSTIAENATAGNNLTTEWSATGNITAREIMAQVPTWNVRTISCVQNQTCGYSNELGSFSLYNGSVYNNINTCARCYFTIDMTTGYELTDWDKLLGDAQLLSQSDQDLLAIINTYGLNTAGLTGQSKMFHYMFRCDDLQHNIMPEVDSYDYQIFTYPPFNMTIVEPENIGYLMDVPVFVNTTRETVCKYSIDRLYTWDNMSFIDGENYGFEHRTILENLTNAIDPGRTHTIYVRCRDLGSLEVRDSKPFRVILDNQAPIVIRMLHELSDDTLMIETNEEADCVFSQDSLKKCNYNFSLGQAMMSVDRYKQSYHWMPSILYYVKCKDKWNNYPGTVSNSNECTSIINPYDVPAI